MKSFRAKLQSLDHSQQSHLKFCCWSSHSEFCHNQDKASHAGPLRSCHPLPPWCQLHLNVRRQTPNAWSLTEDKGVVPTTALSPYVQTRKELCIVQSSSQLLIIITYAHILGTLNPAALQLLSTLPPLIILKYYWTVIATGEGEAKVIMALRSAAVKTEHRTELQSPSPGCARRPEVCRWDGAEQAKEIPRWSIQYVFTGLPCLLKTLATSSAGIICL